MAKHNTHKSTRDGKSQTLARRAARSAKFGATRVNRAGRPVKSQDVAR